MFDMELVTMNGRHVFLESGSVNAVHFTGVEHVVYLDNLCSFSIQDTCNFKERDAITEKKGGD